MNQLDIEFDNFMIDQNFSKPSTLDTEFTNTTLELEKINPIDVEFTNTNIELEKINPIDHEFVENQKRKYNKYEGPVSSYTLHKKNGNIQNVTYIRKKFISAEQIQEMKDLLAQGVQKKIICAQFKITFPTLQKYLAK